MTVEEIKQSVSMHDVLSRYGVRVLRNGMCSCPFHTDKHPSMKVFSDGYKCFSCGKNGDVFNFVMEMERCDFKTAYLSLGGEYEEHKSKLSHDMIKAKFERNRLQKEREIKAENDFKSMLLKSIRKCEENIQKREVFSDAWCESNNILQWLWSVWELKYIREESVSKADVIRVCKRIERI